MRPTPSPTIPPIRSRAWSPGSQTRPVDCRSIEDRVLIYTSEPLTEDLHVVGPVTAVLHASSSAPDTDWVVRLCDVWPDGRSILVCDGILRARYRDSFDAPDAAGARPGLPVRGRPARHRPDVPGRPPAAGPRHQQRLPPLRPQPEHRRPVRRGGGVARWPSTPSSTTRCARRTCCCRSCRRPPSKQPSTREYCYRRSVTLRASAAWRCCAHAWAAVSRVWSAAQRARPPAHPGARPSTQA